MKPSKDRVFLDASRSFFHGPSNEHLVYLESTKLNDKGDYEYVVTRVFPETQRGTAVPDYVTTDYKEARARYDKFIEEIIAAEHTQQQPAPPQTKES